MNSPASPPLNIGETEMEEMEPTRGWRPLVVPAIVVIIGLAIAWALFAHYGQTKPEATGSILRQAVYPIQVNGVDVQAEAEANPGMPGTVPQQNEIVLLVQASIKNVTHQPITIFDINANVQLDGASNQSAAALPEDVDRLFQRFPDLEGFRMQPLQRHQVIAPGQTVQGLMVFAYPWSQQQWDQHKKSNVVIGFDRGKSLALPFQ